MQFTNKLALLAVFSILSIPLTAQTAGVKAAIASVSDATSTAAQAASKVAPLAPQSSNAYLAGLQSGSAYLEQEHVKALTEQEKLDFITGYKDGLSGVPSEFSMAEKRELRAFLDSAVKEKRELRWNNGQILIKNLVNAFPKEFRQVDKNTWIHVEVQGSQIPPTVTGVSYKVLIKDAIAQKVINETKTFTFIEFQRMNRGLTELINLIGQGGKAKAYFAAPAPVPFLEPLLVYVEVETQAAQDAVPAK